MRRFLPVMFAVALSLLAQTPVPSPDKKAEEHPASPCRVAGRVVTAAEGIPGGARAGGFEIGHSNLRSNLRQRWSFPSQGGCPGPLPVLCYPRRFCGPAVSVSGNRCRGSI